MKKYTILIVDDEIEIVRTVIDLLENQNPDYYFYSTTRGAIGLRIAEAHLPDLIVTDWDMPEMTGIEFIKKLKNNSNTADIPVIMLTGIMTETEHLKIALEAGAIDYIRKPIDEIELSARINSMLLHVDSNRELVGLKERQLVSISLNVKRKNKQNLLVIDKLGSVRNRLNNHEQWLRDELSELIHIISQETKADSWMSFRSYFENVHPSFFRNLVDLCPDLTPAEIKLAAFLRLNLTSKEIASILFITPDSVKTGRNRLRRKLNLKIDQNLNTFIISL